MTVDDARRLAAIAAAMVELARADARLDADIERVRIRQMNLANTIPTACDTLMV